MDDAGSNISAGLLTKVPVGTTLLCKVVPFCFLAKRGCFLGLGYAKYYSQHNNLADT